MTGEIRSWESIFWMKLKSFGFQFVRVCLIFFSFTLDVKVHADVRFHVLEGKVDIQRQQAIIVVAPHELQQEPLELEVFDGALAKLSLNAVDLGVEGHSFLDLTARREIEFYSGTVLVRYGQPVSGSSDLSSDSDILLKTLHCNLLFKKAEFLVTGDHDKTSITVISGEVDVTDRANQKTWVLREGYSQWIGGLKAEGGHEHGASEALHFDETMKALAHLGTLTPFELQARYDQLKPVWKTAVEAVSARDQKVVLADLGELEDYFKRQARLEVKAKHERAQLKEYFREKSLGL